MTHILIDPSLWQITLSTYPPLGVLDNSQLAEFGQCPRKYLYRYGMRRGFSGKSWPIQYGLAYHKYREDVENLMLEAGCEMNDEIHIRGLNAALTGWEDPPFGHKKEYLDRTRLIAACDMARVRIAEEQRTGRIIVTQSEDSFDLELPFTICKTCGWANLDDGDCPNCGCESAFFRPRHGGRVDQFVKYTSLLAGDMIRDFKTTGFMGPTYTQKFDPSGQLQGYTWGKGELSGRMADGALIETVYNTKTRGPEITQHYVTFSKGQQVQWLASVMMEWQALTTMWSRVPELGYLAFPQRTSACSNYGGCRFRGSGDGDLGPCRAESGWQIENWLENNTIHSHWDFAEPEKEEAKV